MVMDLQFNLRFALLALGALFVIAILVDGLRRKYRRNRRFVDYDTKDTHGSYVTDHDYQQPVSRVITRSPHNAAERSTQTQGVTVEAVATKASFAASIAPTPTAAATGTENLVSKAVAHDVLVVYLRANAGKSYVGYELLQALLSVGLRFGEMGLFHRYQELNGTGDILFSLAQAKEPGVFDIHNMGGVSCVALCAFIRLGEDELQNIKNLDLMLETANEIVEDLGGELLDDAGEVFVAETYKAYRQHIQLVHQAIAHDTARVVCE